MASSAATGIAYYGTMDGKGFDGASTPRTRRVRGGGRRHRTTCVSLGRVWLLVRVGRPRRSLGVPVSLGLDIRHELCAGLVQLIFMDDVIAVEDGAGAMAGELHRDPLGDPGTNKVASRRSPK